MTNTAAHDIPLADLAAFGALVHERLCTAPTLSTFADEVQEAAKEVGISVWAPDDDENPYTATEGVLTVEMVDLTNDQTEADAWSLTGWAIIERGGSDPGLVDVFADEADALAALAVRQSGAKTLSPSDALAVLCKIVAERPCLDADTSTSDLAYWARLTVIPALDEAGLL